MNLINDVGQGGEDKFQDGVDSVVLPGNHKMGGKPKPEPKCKRLKTTHVHAETAETVATTDTIDTSLEVPDRPNPTPKLSSADMQREALDRDVKMGVPRLSAKVKAVMVDEVMTPRMLTRLQITTDMMSDMCAETMPTFQTGVPLHVREARRIQGWQGLTL